MFSVGFSLCGLVHCPSSVPGTAAPKTLFRTRLSRNSLSWSNVALRDLRTVVLYERISLYLCFFIECISQHFSCCWQVMEHKVLQKYRLVVRRVIFNGCPFPNMWCRFFLFFNAECTFLMCGRYFFAFLVFFFLNGVRWELRPTHGT